MQWTEQQRQVIEQRDANILVSAAAGSGKTAVLVQRIIEKIMDETHPVNIDQLVIVTFTQAAAGEMRARIQAAIEEQAALHPDNEHLQRQRTRIHMANISTIHSFCRQVIQNHFQEIDLEPSFRVGDEGELKLMRHEVLEEVLEELYEEGDEAFCSFTEAFSSGKNDEKIEELILQLYEYSMSDPFPGGWLQSCVEHYRTDDNGGWQESGWMKALFTYMEQMAQYVLEICDWIWRILDENDGTEAYKDIFAYYREKAEQLLENKDYEQCQKSLEELSHPALPRGKKACPDVEVREQIKAQRDHIKKILENLRDTCFKQKKEIVEHQLASCRDMLQVIVRVTIRFMEAFRGKKRSKNLMDFHDLEHEAMRILRDENGAPTPTAEEYAGYFDEILIDEYQDSNLVQEYLLTSVSKIPFGRNNMFMVGDCKQSIYRFRLARPELFMEKFNSYSLTEGACRRIDLHNNFRSRGEVLMAANYIFDRIMHKELGGIEYDEAAALYQGMKFEPAEHREDTVTELLLFDKKELDMDSVQYEAKMIAHRIKRLVSDEDGVTVVDKSTGAGRRAQYRDIAILLRSTSGYDSVLIEELAAEGIPAYVTSREGYFETIEVSTILSYLKIIDNPLQDIPFLTVLQSPVAAVTDEELAVLRIENEDKCLYECVVGYVEHGSEENLKHKLSEFLQQLRQFREEMCYMPIHRFICHILDVTGYGEMIGVMPGGERRRANVEMLVEKAAAFEQTSYAGVFRFVRYVEQLHKYQVDAGEASLVNENDNTVRIMTIHKSKGLEFPIVFVAGLGRRFNQSDSRQALALHPSLGIGIDDIDPVKRTKSRTLYKQVLQLQNRLEGLGEELRVLYVALTRAREKLILTAGAENLSGSVTRAFEEGYAGVPSAGCLSMAGCYLDWVMCALASHPAMRPLQEQYMDKDRMGVPWNASAYQADFSVHLVTLEQLMQEDLQEMAQEERMDMELDGVRAGVLPDEVSRALEYRYGYLDEMPVPAKVSVSELKRAQLEEEGIEHMFCAAGDENKTETKAPERTNNGAERGNAYHKAFECLDFSDAGSVEAVEAQLEQMCRQGILTEDAWKLIRPWKVYEFARSPVGERMERAYRSGKLYREQPFVFAMPAGKLSDKWASEEPVLIQGIIDVFFEEDGELVLLDYKTDYIGDGEEQVLIQRYAAQMKYYREVLERLLHKRVRECLLYSVCLEKTLLLPDAVLK